jgi:hypothetical protein
VDRRRKPGVSPATDPAAGGNDRRSLNRQVGDALFSAIQVNHGDLRSNWHGQFQVLPAAAGLVGTLPVITSLCTVYAAPPQLLQVPDRAAGLNDDVGAVSTIAAIGSAAGNVLLPAEANDAVTTVSTFQRELYAVYHAIIIDSGN